ncbi:MAG: ribosome maturation factor RimP [Gemmatimonadota bacterium]|nr:ribosome maturation factor RimP [Gemmatimonadota bacterium]
MRHDELETVVAQALEELSFDLVELRVGGSRARPTLDVRIDRRDGGSVSVDDCARASRVVEARLDGGELVAERYVLEVSSPGVERVLRRPDDWRRFAGRRAKVLSRALGGRVEVEIVGLEGGAGAEVAVVRTARGDEQRIPLAEVEEARLAFHW